LSADERFLDGSPDGVVYAVMCFLVRVVEALGAAALLTSSFAIIANTFPDRVATMFVRTNSCNLFSPLNSQYTGTGKKPLVRSHSSGAYFTKR